MTARILVFCGFGRLGGVGERPVQRDPEDLRVVRRRPAGAAYCGHLKTPIGISLGDAVVENPEQGEEDRRLEQDRQARGQRVGARLLVERHHLLGLALLVPGVLGLDLLDLRLDRLHVALGADLLHEQRDQQDPDDDDQADDRDRSRTSRCPDPEQARTPGATSRGSMRLRQAAIATGTRLAPYSFAWCGRTSLPPRQEPLLRHMVDPTGGPRVAAHQPADRKEEALDRPMRAHRPQSISRAGGVVATGGPEQRRDEPLVAADAADQDQGQQPSQGHVPERDVLGRQPSRALSWGHRGDCPTGPCPDLDTARRSADDRSWSSSADAARAAAGGHARRRRCPAGRSVRSVGHEMAQLPDDPVAHDGATHGAAHDEADACRVGAGARPRTVALRCTTSVRVAARLPVRTTLPESSARRILRCAGSTSGTGLGRESVAALAATGGEHGTAGAGAHTRAEAMRAGTSPVVRLEGALHRVSSLRQGWITGEEVVGGTPRSPDRRLPGYKGTQRPSDGSNARPSPAGEDRAHRQRPMPAAAPCGGPSEATGPLAPARTGQSVGRRGPRAGTSEPVENSCPIAAGPLGSRA